MKRSIYLVAIMAALLFLTTACASPIPGRSSTSGRASQETSQDLQAGNAEAGSEQNDKAFNLGGSYLGDNKQMTSNIYGARKSSTPAWGGTLQAGIIQGAQSAKEMKETLAAAMTNDPVLLGLIKRQELLLARLADLPDGDDGTSVQTQLDALVPMLEAAMTRVHESVRVASGGDLRSLKAIIVGSMQHNGNTVGATPLNVGEGEFEAYGKGFETLPAVLKAIMGEE